MANRPASGTPQLSRRTKALLVLGAVVVVIIVGGSRLVDLYVDWAWFGEVGFRGVFGTILVTRIVQFVVAAVFLGGVLALNLVIAYRVRPVFVPVTAPEDPLARYRTVIQSRPKLFAIAIPALIALIGGLSAQGDWQTTQLFLHSVPFNQVDPVFGNDISFYVFTLPFLRAILGWVFWAVGISFVGALVTHYFFGGIRLAGRQGSVAPATRAHLAVLAGTFVLFKAVAYFFDRYDLLFSNRKAAEGGANFFGASYTDLNAAMPAKIILLIIAVICAGAFFAAVVLRNLQIPAIALALLVFSSIVVGAAWPAVLEQFSVRANAIDREAQSISRNIAATRQAFGLTDVSVIPYAPQVSSPTTGVNALPQDVANSQATLSNIRIQDPSRLNRAYAVQQQLTNFYTFSPDLDIDRYTVGGQRQDFVLAAREINPDALIGNQQDWFNRHLVYTHGQGIVSAPADRVNTPVNDPSASQSGLPDFQISDSQNPGPLGVSPDGARTYYGEFVGGDNDYAIVGGNPGDTAKEFDGPGRAASSYTGTGGVPLGNWAQRLMFATAYGERNILFNGSIGDDSRILYNRDPVQRVEKVAPWLRTDVDPYPAVVDGRTVWIVDAYTTLPRYPYAQQVDLGESTSDSLRPGTSDGSVGYMRNSVKATVDAYSGQVSLYESDPTDPVLKTWEAAFPGVVKPASAVSPDLRAHFRYPEDIFKVQRDLLTRYHVENPRDFFSTQNFWTVPEDPTRDNNANIPPYYLLAGDPRPGAAPDTQFQMTSTLLALSRPNLSAYLSVSSEPENYGRMTVLELPAQLTGDQRGPQGPQQVQAELLTSQNVNQGLFTLRQSGTPVAVQYGNLLTLPVSGGLLYVEPIYVERNAQTSFPQLFGVIARFNNGTIGYAPTLQGALSAAFQGVQLPAGLVVPGLGPAAPATAAPAAPGVAVGNGQLNTGAAGQALSPALTKAVTDINTAIGNLSQAQAARDFRGIGDAEAALDTAVKAFQQASGTTPAAAPAGSGG